MVDDKNNGCVGCIVLLFFFMLGGLAVCLHFHALRLDFVTR
jgi:hypothetical protein